MKLWHKLASALPACQEKNSYGIPNLFDKEMVTHYGSNKCYLGIYPFPKTILTFEDKEADIR